MGTAENDTERHSTGDQIIDEWEQLVKNTECELIEKKLTLCNRAVEWWNEEVKEAMTVRPEACATFTSKEIKPYQVLGGVCHGYKNREGDGRGVEERGYGRTKYIKQAKISMVG